MHTLFDTYDYYKTMMDDLMREFASDDDKNALIDEHRKLVDKTKEINKVPYTGFSENNYPYLKAIVFNNDTTRISVLHYNYEATKELHKSGDVVYNNNSR